MQTPKGAFRILSSKSKNADRIAPMREAATQVKQANPNQFHLC